MTRLHPLAAAMITTVALAGAPSASAGMLTAQGPNVTYSETDPNARNVVTVRLSTDGTRIVVTDSGRSSGSAIRLRSDGSCSVSRSTGSCPAAGVMGIDVLVGELDDAVTQATALASALNGGTGNDRLTGGPGNDTFRDPAGADAFVGGDGTDTLEYNERIAGVAVSLDDNAGDGEAGENDNAGADIEVVSGGSGPDTLIGSAAANTLYGNAGDDVLDGGAGPDALVGGDGADRATWDRSGVGVRVTLDGQANDGATGENDNADAESVTGSPHDDVLVGNAAANALAGGAGNDRLLPGAATDALDAGPGDDILQTLDGAQDLVVCGEGEDGVVSDRADTRSDCDYIKYRVLAAGDTSVRRTKAAVRIPVRCSPATVEGCRGSATLKVGSRTIGARRVRLPSGRRWVARITLNRSGRALLRRERLLTASLVVRDRDATGVLTVTTQTIRIAR